MQSILEGRRRSSVFNSGAMVCTVCSSVARHSTYGIVLITASMLKFVNF